MVQVVPSTEDQLFKSPPNTSPWGRVLFDPPKLLTIYKADQILNMNSTGLQICSSNKLPHHWELLENTSLISKEK